MKFVKLNIFANIPKSNIKSFDTLSHKNLLQRGPVVSNFSTVRTVAWLSGNHKS